MYEIYTLPSCEHCHHAMEMMRERKIDFQNTELSSPAGVAKFRRFYSEHKENIRREDGSVVLPVLIYQEDGKTRIHQGSEGLEKFLDSK